MRIATCPRCGKPRPAFDGKTVSCQRCRQTTQLSTATAFLEKANALWPGIEVTPRSKRMTDLIEEHDAYLKKRGDYDIITATLDDNYKGVGSDGYLDDGDTEV